MDEHTPRRRGRPRKAVPDDAGEPSIPDGAEAACGDGEVSFVASEQAAPAPSRWRDLTQRALDLELAGHLVTQVHTRDNMSGIHPMDNCGAVIYGNESEDYLVTSDGKKHLI